MIILGTNSIKDTGFDVANSLRTNRGSSDYLSRTNGSAGNRRTFTISFWMKIAEDYANAPYIFGTATSGTNIGNVYFHTSGALAIEAYTGSYVIRLFSDAILRDQSAFYHICYAVDTTQGTEANRVKLYINGVQQTFNSSPHKTFPSQNTELPYNQNSGGVTINCQANYNAEFMGAYYSEFCMIDGSALAPTSFGEFDEDSGIWKPIDVSGLTFGNNGFYLDFEDSSALGNDAAGSNNFTVNNLTAIDQSTDTCTNNAPVFNSLYPSDGTIAFSEGNLKLVSSGTNGGGVSTFGVSSGKWYFEIKQTGANEPLGNGEMLICVTGDPEITKGSIDNFEGRNYSYGIRNNGGTKFANATSYNAAGSWHGNWGASDIISIALDMDNHNVYFAKNGQYANGSGSWNQAFTGSPAAISLSTAVTNYFIGVGHAHSSATGTFELNALSPSFSISSGNQDANGYGNFEYAVPSSYFSCTTINLAENS